MRSKYPNKIDSEKELSIAKDNLTELRADLFNSYRSAIIQIEKTLGIMPNGIEGQSLSSRLNVSIDDIGNIKKEALDYLNLLSGPIDNSDVKDDANISESKLGLNFSTNFLYNQIVSLERLISELDNFLDEINSALASHINKRAKNRHSALSISIDEQTVGTFGKQALSDLQAQNLQDFAEKIIFNHIKYSGNSIDYTNNSHRSDQIFFDNTFVQDIISDSNLQGVIESIVLGDAEYLRDVLLNISANSRLRNGSVKNNQSGSDGEDIISGTATVGAVNSNGLFLINLDQPVTISKDIRKFDLISIDFGIISADYTKVYYVYEDYAEGDSVSSITVSGNMDVNLYGQPLDFTVVKNNVVSYNQAGMNLSIRYSSSYSGVPYVFCCDPNSSKIVSNGIRPFEINSSNSEIIISLDQEADHTIDVYNSSLQNQTIDSIVERINKYGSENNVAIAATKVNSPSSTEICIFNMIPNISIDDKARSIQIKTSTALNSLGFSESENKIFYGMAGNSIISNGKIISEHFKYFQVENYILSASSNTISRDSGSFITDGINPGGFVFIEGASSADDNGLFIVRSVSDLEIIIDHTFSGSTANEKIIYLGNGVDLSNYSFSELSIPTLESSAGGSILFDLYYDEKSRNILTEKRLEASGFADSSGFSVCMSSISENFIKSSEYIKISIDSSAIARFHDADGTISDPITISSSGKYILYNKSKSKFIELNFIFSTISATDIEFYGTSDLVTSVLKIGSLLYSNSLGKVFGTNSSGSGITYFETTIKDGPVDEYKISNSFVEKNISKPLFESIGNYIAFGVQLVGSHTYSSQTLTFSLSGGIVYISGRRISVRPNSNLTFDNIDSTKKYFFSIDKSGSIIASEEIQSGDYSGYSKSFDKQEMVFAIFDAPNNTLIELKQKFDSINDKLDKTIYVSPLYTKETSVLPNSKKANFSSIHDALNYCEYFKRVSGASYVPDICLLDGHHYIEEPINIKSSVNIYGHSKNVYIHPEFGSGIYLKTGDLSSSSTTIGSNNCIFNISNELSEDKILVSLKNISFKYTASQNGIFAAVLVSDNTTDSFYNSLCFEDISFECASGSYTSSSSYKIMIPILFQELNSSSAVVTGQTFQNLFFKNIKCSGLYTDGFAVKFLTSGSSNIFRNIVSESALLKDQRLNSGSAQFFGSGSYINSTSTIFNSSTGTINGMSEINTVIQ